MGARNRLGIGWSYRPARLHSLAESVPRNRFLGSLKVYKFGLRLQTTQPGGIGSLESILVIFKSLKILALWGVWDLSEGGGWAHWWSRPPSEEPSIPAIRLIHSTPPNSPLGYSLIIPHLALSVCPWRTLRSSPCGPWLPIGARGKEGGLLIGRSPAVGVREGR